MTATYDYFVAGRWRDNLKIRALVNVLKAKGKNVYCFIDNEYNSDGIRQTVTPQPDELVRNVAEVDDWQTNPTFRSIFENDMRGLQNSLEFIIVLPAGLSAHMELGVAHGLGKKCYAIGEPDKAETLYLMLDGMCPTVEAFITLEMKEAI